MAEDIVHRTDPVAGTIVVDGQTVYLFYNPRKELQEVPNVEGQAARRRPADPERGGVPDRPATSRGRATRSAEQRDPHRAGGR